MGIIPTWLLTCVAFRKTIERLKQWFLPRRLSLLFVGASDKVVGDRIAGTESTQLLAFADRNDRDPSTNVETLTKIEQRKRRYVLTALGKVSE